MMIILTTILCLLGACEKLPQDDPEKIAAPVPIELTKADADIRDASNAAGLDVFQRLCAVRDGVDVSFSPLSLSLAFAMVAEGAGGETWRQLADGFGWGVCTQEELGAFYAKMIEGLVKADPRVSFTSSNSVWMAPDLKVKDPYSTLLADHFGAEAYTVDFSLPSTIGRINTWCSDKTDGMIPRMLSQLDPDTRMMLINALLYKAPWALEWTVRKNRDFRTANGRTQKDYLYADGEFGYADLGDCEALSLPYGNTAYEMVVFLPKTGKSPEDILPTVAEHGGKLRLHPRDAEVYFPKFTTEYSTEEHLIPILKAKGIQIPFSDFADFSGISDGESLKINEVLQKVKIEVTEKGTEFAAVTVITMVMTAALQPPSAKILFDADHPFVYLIRETSTDAILLLGTLSK